LIAIVFGSSQFQWDIVGDHNDKGIDPNHDAFFLIGDTTLGYMGDVDVQSTIFTDKLCEIGFFEQFSLGGLMGRLVRFNRPTNASPMVGKGGHAFASMKEGNFVLSLRQNETCHNSVNGKVVAAHDSLCVVGKKSSKGSTEMEGCCH
jgi:hypothetical protein